MWFLGIGCYCAGRVTNEDDQIKELAAALEENKAALDRAHRLIDKLTLRLESVCPEAVQSRPYPNRYRRSPASIAGVTRKVV